VTKFDGTNEVGYLRLKKNPDFNKLDRYFIFEGGLNMSLAKRIVFNILRNYNQFVWHYSPQSGYFAATNPDLEISMAIHRSDGSAYFAFGKRSAQEPYSLLREEAVGGDSMKFAVFISENEFPDYHGHIANIESAMSDQTDVVFSRRIESNLVPNFLLNQRG